MITFVNRGAGATIVVAAAAAILVLSVRRGSAESELDSILQDTGGEGRPAEELEEPSAPAGTASAPPPEQPAHDDRAATGRPAPGHRVVEEIFVTAQKTEQAIEDVPIAMSVLTEDFIAEHGITDFNELARFVPNVSIPVAGFFISPNIRGFALNDASNLAFEPPVSIASDGIPYTQLAYFQGALFDVARVEVLRGPQGTTFGKNATAGLLSVVTKDPTDDFTGSIGLEVGDFDRRRVDAAVGGALVRDLVNFRLAALDEERGGFVDNTTASVVPSASDPLAGNERRGLRSKLQAPNLLGSVLTVGYEHLDLSSSIGAELFHVSESTRAIMRQWDPDADFERGNLVASIDGPDVRDTRIDTVTADWTHDVGGWALDAVFGHSILDTNATLDNDFSPAPGLVATTIVEAPTTTVEIRAVPPVLPGLFGLDRVGGAPLGTTELLVGFFYQRRDLDPTKAFFTLHDGPAAALIASDSSSSSIPPLDVPLAPLPVNLLDPTSELVEEGQINFVQEGHALAGFGQMRWQFLENWMVQYGMRLNYETKDGLWDVRQNTPVNVLFPALGFEEFTTTRSHSEFQLSPKVALNYKPWEEMSLFVHWTRGFKGGGFNAFVFSGQSSDFEFEDESATEWAFDAKTKLLDGALRLNLSLFRLTVRDFQVLTRESPLPTILIENAPEARAQGVEMDLTWLPTEWLTIVDAFGFNDTEYLDFKIGTCPAGMSNTDGDDDERCDQTGRRFTRAPEFNNTLSTSIRIPVAWIPGLASGWAGFWNGIDLTNSFTFEYASQQYLESSLDPRREQPSFVRLRASIGLENPEQGWSLRMVGENLTDEVIGVFSPLSIAVQSFGVVEEPPRVFFGQFRWTF